MKNIQNLLVVPLLVMIALLAGACIRPPTNGTPAAETPTAIAETATPAASETVTATVAATTTTTSGAATSGAAKATVNVNSLRVRALPDNTSAVVTGIKQSETYNVIGLSSDGLWVQLEIPQAPEGKGWVSANFVTVEGSITDIKITPVTETTTVTTTTSTTETGVMTETPAMTDTTTATETPAMTETAMMTETPAITDTTTVTETPAMTETGTMTETPAITDTTTVTETPATTETGTMTGTSEMTGTTSITTVVPAPGMAVVATSDGTRLRVRSEPNADAQIVGYAYNGETFQVLASSEDSQWVQIAGSTAGKGENPNGGWVAAQFLVIGQ